MLICFVVCAYTYFQYLLILIQDYEFHCDSCGIPKHIYLFLPQHPSLTCLLNARLTNALPSRLNDGKQEMIYFFCNRKLHSNHRPFL